LDEFLDLAVFSFHTSELRQVIRDRFRTSGFYHCWTLHHSGERIRQKFIKKLLL